MEERNLVPIESVVIEDSSADAEPYTLDDAPEEGIDEEVGNIVSFVEEKFEAAKTSKEPDEQRALKAYRNYRGVYGSDTQFTSTEKSKVFVKVTKSKVLAGYGQTCDILFGSDKFPIDVMPTPIPSNVAESVHFSTNPQTQEEEDTGEEETKDPGLDLSKLEPGETINDLKNRLGAVKERLKPIMGKLKEGPGTTPEMITVHPAQRSADKMKKLMHDQLEETGARKALRMTTFEACLLGTGIIKGPQGIEKEYPNWVAGKEEGQADYRPTKKFIPKYDHVSFWAAYPDPDATSMDDAEFFIERHKLSKSQLRALKKRPTFRKTAIDAAIESGANYTPQWWESHLEEEDSTSGGIDRYEALEFWGVVDTDRLEEEGLTIPKEVKDLGEASVNVWICNGKVLRLILNPHKPSYIPYFVVPYELNPYSFFGIGIAENMSDTQLLMNGFMRMAVDNAALAGNLVFEIDRDNMEDGQDLSIYPGKVFVRQAGAPGQALFGTKFPNTANENMQLFDKARQLSDEQTGIPSFSHGQTGVTGVGRTSSGISMLMGAASVSIKTVIKNIDEYLLEPIGKSLFQFNMQFNYDKNIKGDLEIKARGTESYISTEVRSQRLMQFLQTTSNPQDQAFARRDYILREIAKSLELDPDKVVNNMADAAIQAEFLAKIQKTMAPEAPPNAPPEGQPGAPALPNPSDTGGNGNANIGVGQVPVQGEQGFTGNPNSASVMPQGA